MSYLIFLGGTVGNNPWRDAFIAALVSRGIDRDRLFDPVVEDWDESAIAREEQAKAAATHHIYYIADSQLPGSPLSAYSMVEATMALYDRPDTTAVIFDTVGMDGHPLRAVGQCAKVLTRRFPSANIFVSREEAEDWLIGQLQGTAREEVI